MNYRWAAYIFLVLMGSIFLGCQEDRSHKLTIAAAANTQFAISEIIEDFSQKTGVECDLVLSSSGKLNAQIKEGAPYDIFVSADMYYPQDLYDAGLAIAPPVKYAKGALVLWSADRELQPSVEVLKAESVQHIALANPKTAPYGKASMQFLESVEVLEDIQSKLVYGEGVNQTNQYIISESVQFGITSKSVVLSEKMRDRGQWIELDQREYDPIEQGMVILKNGKESLSHQFGEYLLSKHAQSILSKYGYKAPI